jgi:hypothetical protein
VEQQLDHVSREYFSSFVEGEVPTWVHVVGIGAVPIELRSLALQGNFRTSKGILHNHLIEGLWGYDETPSQAQRVMLE